MELFIAKVSKGLVAHMWNPSTQEAEAGKLLEVKASPSNIVISQPGLKSDANQRSGWGWGSEGGRGGGLRRQVTSAAQGVSH